MEFTIYNNKFEKEILTMIYDFFDFHAGLVSSKDELTNEARLKEIINEWISENHELYLIKIGKEIIGFCHLWYKGEIVCWVEDLYIIPEERGKGYGSYSLKLAENIVRSKPGYQAISLDVSIRNQTAIDLYFKNGYDSISLITLRKEFYENKRDKTVNFLEHEFFY
ncbi:GNAT family N-acetyltransferase [Macrococcoides goetzii]|uniref:GNAT family N-acetyltransferase n=1 Tax=Macrococcoides goetzii TaxID=1891097 RepID=A0A2G5NSJ1_9STAP|nr:GNAT family N-acetyltransferase [Macrococcus goetzii]RAI82659.1 GNAT family N-acetyltransferase [Macrococcus goetzii]